MAIEQDLIIKIKAVLDQNVQNTIKQLNSTITKGIGGGKGGVFGDTKDVLSYAKQMKAITGEIKLSTKEKDQLIVRQKQLNKTIQEQEKLLSKIREHTEKTAKGSKEEANSRQQALQTAGKLQRTRKTADEVEGLLGGGAGPSGGGGGKFGGLSKAILAMGGGVAITRMIASAPGFIDEIAFTGAQRRATARAGLSNDYTGAVMGGRYSAGMVRSSPGELARAKRSGLAGGAASTAKDMFTGGFAGAGVGAAAGAGIGAFFGGVGAVPGALIGGAVGGVAGAAKGALNFDKNYTRSVRENIQLREEELQPLMEMMDRHQQRQIARFGFMRQTGLSNLERPLFRQGGITDQMRQYGMTEGESMQAIAGVSGAAGSSIAMDAARSGTLGKLNAAGFGDQAGRGLAQSALVGGNNLDAARRYAQLVGTAFATSFGDTPTAKALTDAGQAIEKQTAGEFGKIGEKTSQDFMALASSIFQQYGGQSIGNVQRAQSLQQSITEGSRTTTGVGGLYNISAGAKAGLGLAGQRGMAALSMTEIGDPEAERSKLGYTLSEKERGIARREKSKSVVASQLGFGIERSDISKEISGRVDAASKLPEDQQAAALNDIRADIRKRAASREGKVTALGAGGDFEKALQLQMATSIVGSGIKGTAGEEAEKELAGAAKAGMGTEAARVKGREVETERTDISAAETTQFRNKIIQIEEESKKSIENTFKLLRDKLIDLETQTATMQIKSGQ